MDWKIHQMDVKAAFVNGILNVKIYMDQEEGFVQEKKKHLGCKFKKKLFTG